MQILPVSTPLLKAGDDLVAILKSNFDFLQNDILCISSKAVATVEGAAIEVSDDDAFAKAVERETKRMNGKVIHTVSETTLTELKPDGFEGTLLVPNAGLDQSNVEEGYAIGWPLDPIASVQKLFEDLDIAIVLTDSGLSPRRLGVTAFALAVAGLDPLVSMVGKPDLQGRAILLTEEAQADQLAVAANMLMGNTDQSIPAVIVRDHAIARSDYIGWVPGIERERDLYHGVI